MADALRMGRRAIALLLVLPALGGCADKPAQKPPRPAGTPRHSADGTPETVREACTVTWVGPRTGGYWHQPANWSPARVPGPADQACVGRDRSATVMGGRWKVGTLIDGGGLKMAGGSLELMTPRVGSEIGRLDIEPGAALYTGGNIHLVDVTVKGTLGAGSASIDGPAVVPCGPHSPIGVEACAPPAKPVDYRPIRRAWSRFARLVNDSGDPHAIAALLAPRACADTYATARHQLPRHPAAACLARARELVREWHPESYSPELDRIEVKGSVSYGSARGGRQVQLIRRHGRWHISMFDRYGWSEPCHLRVCVTSPPLPEPRRRSSPAPPALPAPPASGPAIDPRMIREHCTIRWVGPRRGSWERRRNWSPRREPTVVDEACVPRGRTVTIASGRHQAGALIDGGVLEMKGGTLELASPRIASEVSLLRMHRGATLYGAQNLIAVNGLERLGGRMTGGTGAPASGPPLTPCGPHSPPGLPDCAAAPTPDEAGVRLAWRRFVRAVQAGRSPGRLIAPRVCQKSQPYDAAARPLRVRSGDCARMLRDVGWSFAQYPTRLRSVAVHGNRATAFSLAGSQTRFERHGGRWRISGVLNYGDSAYGVGATASA